MGNTIIIVIVLAVLVLALLRAKKYFKRGCGCGSTTVHSAKKRTEPKLGEKILVIEGMHCEKCRNRIENALNQLDGVAAKVNLHEKTVTVSYSAEVSDALLKETVEKLGFTVTEIR